MIEGLSSARLAGAALVLLTYLALCARIGWQVAAQRRAERARAASLLPAATGQMPVLVAYASQTGQAEDIAWHTSRLLHAAGQPVEVMSLSNVDAQSLARATRALFIVSTYGEGDPPDNAALFATRVMPGAMDLSHLAYGVLALGDATYAHYCGFGRALDAWLAARGAAPEFERIDVDRADAAAIGRWQHQLGHVASLGDVPGWQDSPFADWTLAARAHLNPGSLGGPVFHIELAPPPGLVAQWSSGDLVQVRAPADEQHPREYSIGSIPGDGHMHLLVRRQAREDGTPGIASGWLTGQADTHGRQLDIGGTVQLRLRVHRNFRLEDNLVRPLVLIGNGTGLAGLRGHLRARAAAGRGENWLVFGERQSMHDAFYRDEIRAWMKDGLIARADLVFSRDQPERRYVQHRLREAADEVRDWAARGAAFYVCGSLEGMAQAVDDALAAILGRDALDSLALAGRYRRDVY